MADRPCYLRKATGRRRRAQAEGRTGDEEARCQGSGRLTLPEAGRPRLARFEVISMHRHLRAGRALAVAGLILGGAASLPVALAQPAFAAHAYTWNSTCSGDGSCNTSWNWTQNGVVIANPSSGSVVYNSGFNCTINCSMSSSGSTLQFVQPDTANGITATLTVCAGSGTGAQCNTQTSAQSFAPGSGVSVSLSASVKGKTTNNCFPGYPCGGSKQASEAATLNLNS